jgi:hypothetical protein
MPRCGLLVAVASSPMEGLDSLRGTETETGGRHDCFRTVAPILSPNTLRQGLPRYCGTGITEENS